MDQSTGKPRTRPARALLRVLRAPAFVLGLWATQLLFAKLLAGPARAAAQASMGRYAWFDDGHRLRAIIELIADQPGVMATIGSALQASAIAAGVFSVLASPLILARLAGVRSWAELLSSSASKLPGVIVQTIYGLLFRALCTGLALAPVKLLGVAGTPLLLLIASFPILVLDRARAAVVLDGEPAYHPKTFARALAYVARRPLWWLSGTLIEALKIGVGVAALMLVFAADFAGGSIWLARVGGLLAVALGLWRVSLAVDTRA